MSDKRTDQEIVQEALWMLKGVLDGRAEDFAEEGCSVEQSLALDEGQELAALGLAALGRLVEARDTARRESFERLAQLREASDSMMRLTAERDIARREAAQADSRAAAERTRADRLEVQFAELRAERDVAIQERDEAREEMRRVIREDGVVVSRQAARLERVEAAAREAHHIAMKSRASLRRDQFASPAFKQIRDVLAAALSDVTPPPSE
jgi:hypothetical protein